MSAAQLTEHITRAQLQADVYREVGSAAAGWAGLRGRLGAFALASLPGLPGLVAAAPSQQELLSPAQFCLYEECLAPATLPLQQRR
jgi:hypothetical protein